MWEEILEFRPHLGDKFGKLKEKDRLLRDKRTATQASVAAALGDTPTSPTSDSPTETSPIDASGFDSEEDT